VKPASMQMTTAQRLYGRYVFCVRWIVGVLAAVAGSAIAIMVVVTCADVVGRRTGHSLKGAYDIVELLSAVAIAGALPYTTACKGHVSIEFLTQKLPSVWRMTVGTLARLICLLMFLFLTWRFAEYGAELRASGQVTLTLQWPMFWTAYWMALCSGLMVPVLLYDLVHPGKELMKP
jgi:TRAP-type C4-dicarboxylate transport system permease small subunit